MLIDYEGTEYPNIYRNAIIARNEVRRTVILILQ